MSPVHDLQNQIEQIDLQILRLLVDRVKLHAELQEETDGALDNSETIGLWIEEAADNGLDEAVVEKLCKLVLLLGKKKEE